MAKRFELKAVFKSASREIFWEISPVLKQFLYSVGGISVLFFIAGFWNRAAIWQQGVDDGELSELNGWGLIKLSLSQFLSLNCFRAEKSFKSGKLKGFMLFGFIWGFFLLFMGTVLLTVDHYIFNFLKGPIYYGYSLILDLAGGFFLIALLIGFARRYLNKSVSRQNRPEDAVILALLLLIVLLGFSLEGIRVAVLKPALADWSPVGIIFAKLYSLLGNSGALANLYPALWAAHILAAFIFIAYIPYSKQFHMFAGQITSYAAAKNWREHW